MPAHAEALFEGLTNPSIYDFLDEAPPSSARALAARYARLATRRSPDGTTWWLNWAVWSCETARYVGYVQATVAPDAPAEIAYVLFPSAWGRGFAFESVTAMLAHLREAYGVGAFEAQVDARNTRSIALLRRLGFGEAGTRAKDNGAPDPVYRRVG